MNSQAPRSPSLAPAAATRPLPAPAVLDVGCSAKRRLTINLHAFS